MAENLVRYEVAAGVATMTLDSPANRNALSTAMLRRMLVLLESAGSDKAVRVLVLSHTGRVFCSGMDLAESTGPDLPVNVFPQLLQAFWDFPKPVIARVGGPARAGGIGLLAACDIAVAAADATFAFSEVRLGLVPAVIAATVLPRLPHAAGRELFLTGEAFDGTRAAALGLVNSAVEDVDAEVARYVALLLKGGPTALAATKQVLRQRPTVADFAELVALSGRFFAAEEGREGIAAFREKRPASWLP
jgi:methylglutaconyl-CoA hydratase